MLAVPPYFRSFPSALFVCVLTHGIRLNARRTIILRFSTEGSHTETSVRFRTGCFQPTASILWCTSLHLLTYVHSQIIRIIHDFFPFVKGFAKRKKFGFK